MRYLSGLCCFILGLVLSPFASANWTVESTPVSVSGGSINSSGQVVTMATYKATHPTKGTMYMDRLTAYNKGTTGTLAARRISSARSNLNPLGLLMTGTLLGVGMFLDSVTGDIYSVPPEQASCGTGTAQTCINVYGGGWGGSYDDCQVVKNNNHCFQSLAMAANAVTAKYNSFTWQAGRKPFTCIGRYVGNGGILCTGADGWQGTVDTNYNTVNFPLERNVPGTQATPEEIHDKIFPPVKWDDAGYLGDHLPELLRDPVTNSPAKTQETANKAKEIENAQNVADDPAYTPTSPETVPEPTTDTPPVSGTFPSFCAYAGIMCDFVNWMRKDDDPPEPPDMPTTDLGSPIVFSSGLGSGSCPQNKNVALTWLDSQTFSYQPLCDVAVGIKPLVIASSGIFALLILGGIRGRGQGAN